MTSTPIPHRAAWYTGVRMSAVAGLLMLLVAACTGGTPSAAPSTQSAPAGGPFASHSSAAPSARVSTGDHRVTPSRSGPGTGQSTAGSAGSPTATASTTTADGSGVGSPTSPGAGTPRSTTGSAPSTGDEAPTTEQAPRTTAVLPPGGPGNVSQTVPSRSVETKPAVAITAPADFGARVSARILSAAPITAHAVAPGEMSGPAIELTIEISNGSGVPIDLGMVTVNVTGSNGTPGLQVAGPPASPFIGSLPAEQSARGVYVFTLPTNLRNPLSISISYAAAAPVVLFRGNPT